MPQIYLHFLDRELSESLRKEIPIFLVEDITATLLLCYLLQVQISIVVYQLYLRRVQRMNRISPV